MTSHIKACLLGLAVGDALGVLFEKLPRGSFHCMDMTAKPGYLAGFWSDDTAMTLAEIESFARLKKIDLFDICLNFSEWLENGKFSCSGKCFGIGLGTLEAIRRFLTGTEPACCGLNGIRNNGNGALMRWMPFALLKDEYRKDVNLRDAVNLTHGHEISWICCRFYDILLRNLANGSGLEASYRKAFEDLTEEERKVITAPDWDSLTNRSEEEVASGAFVVDTLFASVWCVGKTTNFKDAVLKAVNLGQDTDTTGSVTGVIAGLIYGIGPGKGIPQEWIEKLQRKSELIRAAEAVESMMI